jgi:predicted NAD-dependent protein-ADP-ribosyltransferase YbiA (DUF1768 family)
MTTTIELFDQNSMPFGALSNNAITPFYKDGVSWRSVTHYVYANLLPPGYKMKIMSTPVKDIITKFNEYKQQSLLQLTRNILENGVRTLVSENTQFRELLLSTENKDLFYITNALLFDQEIPILGKNPDGEGLNILGEIYKKIRKEEQNKQFLKKDDEKTREKTAQIIKIILLVKVLQSEMLTKLNDLSSLRDKTFDTLYDQFSMQIEHITHLDRVLLEQYRWHGLGQRKLIDQIENDPNNIVWYVRNYYADQFKLKLYTMRRRALVNHFLSEQLIKRNETEFANNPEALNKELTAQIHEIYKKGNGKFTKELFDNILKLYDDGKLSIPSEIEEKYTTNIDEEFDKKPQSEISGLEHTDTDAPTAPTDTDAPTDPDAPTEPTDPTAPDTKLGDDPQRQNPELDLLKQIGQSESRSMGYRDSNDTPINMEHNETPTFITFTDGVGKYQQLSPYHTGQFSDGFQYPNLIGYYYVKLIYAIGNMVKTKSNIVTIPGAHLPPNLTMPMIKAHRFIMIPECHNVRIACNQFDLKNYITDFSALPGQISEIENRNKVLLLEAALNAKFDKNNNLQALLIQNPSKTIVFKYAENSDPTKRFDEIIGIGRDGSGKNFTGKFLSTLRQKYLDEQSAGDQFNQDIAFLAQMFNNDAQLIGWFYSRAFDMVNTVLLVFLATTHIPNKNDRYEINAEFITNVKNYIYNSCNISFNEFIEIEVSESFFIRINDDFEQKFRTYTNITTDTELPVELSSGAIVEIWRYCCWLMYELALESSRMKQKNNIKLFLTNIVLNMTENTAECHIQAPLGDSSLRNIKTCIVSAIINVLKSIIIIYNGKLPLNTMMIGSVINIIVGKPVGINAQKPDHSNIFEDILPKYPTLYDYITNSNNSHEIIAILNCQYDYLERQSSDSIDITQLENQRIRNRINFFSSIPTRHPQSMIPGVDPSSSSSTSSTSSSSSTDEDLLSQLQILAQLGPVDINSKPVLTTNLKPAGRGMDRAPQHAPFYGAAINRPMDEQSQISVQHDPALLNILGSDEHKKLMSDLSDEFGYNGSYASEDSLIHEDPDVIYDDVPGQFDDDE